MRLNFRLVLLSLLVGLLICPVAGAQGNGIAAAGTTGELRVRIKDQTGRLLQAHATLYGAAMGSGRVLDVAPDGSLTVRDLPFGEYRLELTQAGFSSQTIDFQVRSSAPISREVTLTLHGPSTTVKVIAATPIGSLDVPSPMFRCRCRRSPRRPSKTPTPST